MSYRFMHVFTSGGIFFFIWVNNIRVCVSMFACTRVHVYIHNVFFIHSSVDRRVSCFCILAIKSNAALNMGMQRSLQDTGFISFGYIYPEMGMLDHMIVLFLISWNLRTDFHDTYTSLLLNFLLWKNMKK